MYYFCSYITYKVYIIMDIKRAIKDKGGTISACAKFLGISQPALTEQIKNGTLGVKRLEQIAQYLGCDTSELVGDEIDNGFVSFIRYKGIHYTADNIKEFFKQVEEIKSIAK